MPVNERNSSTPLKVGLTGGIASGKSTVAALFAELGASIIDTDVIARDVVMPGKPALDEIRDAFGDAVIDAAGMLDRAAMRQLVFSDDDKRRQLEAILHPRIQAETYRQSNEAEDKRRLSNEPGGDYQVIVIPLLVESSLRTFVDRILVVDCDEDTQLLRLQARDAESEEQARRILAAQTGREERLAIADDIIQNDDTLAAMRSQVTALHEIYLALA